MRRRFVVAGRVPAIYPPTVEARMAATGGGDGLVVKPHDDGRPKSVATMTSRLELFAIPGLPMVRAGDDLPAMILAGLDRAGETLRDRDVVVVAQKIVSKAEGRTSISVTSSRRPRRSRWRPRSARTRGSSRWCCRSSTKVVRSRPNLMIMQHRLGFVMANAGVDQSNVAATDGAPARPAAAAWTPTDRREAIRARAGGTAGGCGRGDQRQLRPPLAPRHRRGGDRLRPALPSLIDLRGQPDLFGRKLEVSIIGFADEIAAAASLLQGQAAEAQPVVVVRGLTWTAPEMPVAELVRPPEEDLFQ